MRILLDTHMIIWALENSAKLPEKARTLLLTPENDFYISVISLWEIELKRAIRPNSIRFTAKEIADYCKQAGYKIIPLREQDIYILPDLSRPESEVPHKDPFDRILVAQAISTGMSFMTHDSLIKGYSTQNILYV